MCPVEDRCAGLHTEAGGSRPARAPQPAARAVVPAVDAAAPYSTFVPVGRFYVDASLGASLGAVGVWRLLWDQQWEFLADEGKKIRRGGVLKGTAPAILARLVRATRWTWQYLRKRNAIGDDGLRLPVAGEIAIVRRSGAVKVLDLAREQVATVMAQPQARRKLRERVEQVRSVENYPFAPRLTAVALEQGWFAEAFVRGAHPIAFRGCDEGFGDVYLPLLVAFARAAPPEQTQLGSYALELAQTILAPDGLLARLPDEPRARVRAFVRGVSERVADAPAASEPLPLVLSHGDFFSGNVVVSNSGALQAIDWAHVGRRSPLHDLYFVAMSYCGKVMPPKPLAGRIGAMVASLRAQLEQEDPARFRLLDHALRDRDELRRLFYLECIAVPLLHCDDPDDRYVAAMLERVRMFRAFEQALGAHDRAAAR